MNFISRRGAFLAAAGLWLGTGLGAWGQGQLTVRLGAGSVPPVPLVRHGDVWRYHKGTNAPQLDWKTTADAGLDGSWLSGAGGLGYGDGDDVTMLSDMLNGYTTLYIRQTFEIAGPLDPSQHLELVMDWDDGFIAWLDGVEIARSANAPGSAGTEPPYTAISNPPNHEASQGDSSPNPPTVYDLGPAVSRLSPGSHVLALMGLNGAINSSDFSLIADLSLSSGTLSADFTGFYGLVQTNVAVLTGSNTLAGSTRVVVNGVPASFNLADRTWSHTQPLAPGLNRLFIAALDEQGVILSALTRDVIAELATVSVGGTLAGNTTWSNLTGTVRVTNDLTVSSGVTLSILEGTVVLLAPGVSIRVTGGGLLEAAGTETQPVFFLPMTGSNAWGSLNASGAGTSARLRRIETAAGAVSINSQAVGLIEDSFLHDRASIITASQAESVTMRRIHVSNYEETIFNSGTRVLAEDSLFENMRAANSDALEIQGGPPGSIVRRCTFRYSTGGNSDAVDFNGTVGSLVESCLIHHFSDKGVSLGAAGAGGATDYGITVSNCLIYNVDTGVAVKDGSTVGLFQSTLASSTYGMRLYEKFAPLGSGRVTNAFNDIFWGNVNAISNNAGTLVLNYSDVQGTNWPGEGNLDADPLFVNPARGDYRLGAGSPAAAGLGGAPMGISGPVGGIPSGPFNLAARTGSNAVHLGWQENADNEDGFLIERSTNAVAWEALAAVGANFTNYTDMTALLEVFYFYRVRATNASGLSAWSNPAGAVREPPAVFAGGTLTANTTWSPALGEVYVGSNVFVPTNLTLTIEAGTIVNVTNRASITAQAGGAIEIAGAATNPVVIRRWNDTNNWGELRAEGARASIRIRYADISGGQTTVYNGATGLFEDTYFHDFIQQDTPTIFNQPILLAQFPGTVAARRCQVKNYYETLWRNGVITLEDNLFEDMVGDGVDFDSGHSGSVIRRCTFRHGDRSNVDAVDLGNDGANLSAGILVESCLMYDFPFDKGVSIGEAARDVLVTNCLIYNCNWGVGVKDSATAAFCNNTVITCDTGLRIYEKVAGQGSGIVTNAANNILWNNTNSVGVFNNGMLVLTYTDTQGTNWPGEGNLSSDPLFINPAERDYRLNSQSPCVGAGSGGGNLGAYLPVGAPMAPSNPVLEWSARADGQLQLEFWADSERSYTLQRSDHITSGWTNIANIPSPALPRRVRLSVAGPAGTEFYRLITPQRP